MRKSSLVRASMTKEEKLYNTETCLAMAAGTEYHLVKEGAGAPGKGADLQD
jgi:hypothetical protein